MSQPSYSARRSGLAAMLANALGIVVAPIITSAYAMTAEGADLTPAWEPALSTMLGPLLTFASPEAVYATYGKAYLLVFLGFLFGLAGLYRWRLDLAGKLERWGFRLSFVGLALNLLGNITDYWGGKTPWWRKWVSWLARRSDFSLCLSARFCWASACCGRVRRRVREPGCSF